MKYQIHKVFRIASALAFLLGGSLAADTIKLAYPNWPDGIAATHLAKVIFEDEFGYEVQMTMTSPRAIYAAVAAGRQDAMLNAWLPDTQAPLWQKFGNRVVDLGFLLGDARTGLVVPAYMDVESIADLRELQDELDGRIMGIGPATGLHRNTNRAIEAYGLDFRQFASGGPAITDALAAAISEKKPIVVTLWKPHLNFGHHDLKFLDDPKGVFPAEGLKKIVREGFAEDHPEANQFFVNLNLTQTQLLEIMLAIDDRGDQSIEDVVRDWVEVNKRLVESWLPR